MSKEINHDPIFASFKIGDHSAQFSAQRYGARTDVFDMLISGTHSHYWDPSDDRYIDFSSPFDLTTKLVLPMEVFPEFDTPSIRQLSNSQKIALANDNAHWMVSSLLHGEQAALSLCSSLTNTLVDPGGQEYASNQAREEARHVNAFTRYIEARWATPLEPGPALGGLLTELVCAPEVYKKLIGMQILVEGLAMGMFAVIHALTNDPVLKRLTQLVMTDETFHHKFGKTWAARTVPNTTPDEHIILEDWAAHCFEKLLLNLINIKERKQIFAKHGLPWEIISKECESLFSEDSQREKMQQQGNVFRVLVRTLVKSGIITERTRPIYARWLDVEQVCKEEDVLDVVGEIVSQQGISLLKALNGQTSAN